ncbi:hypothetical protein DCAR_0415043 [Daucus carota subsp. sativus]|uniref:Uncharacterized protein n=1 Tax=Daucus carota subsp. sativus TaxID=79200 RepID=A0A165A5R5_DAUCS|nr:PREDICTED: serine protease Do-like HtrA [Daucus carota subsp. sativus]WOG95716.1 hypothetical protein DCAR_0415043 [Daucus carota subsp. sativus]
MGGKTKSQRKREKNKAIAEAYQKLKADYEILLREFTSLKQQNDHTYNGGQSLLIITTKNDPPYNGGQSLLIITTKNDSPYNGGQSGCDQSGYSMCDPTDNGGQSGYSICDPIDNGGRCGQSGYSICDPIDNGSRCGQSGYSICDPIDNGSRCGQSSYSICDPTYGDRYKPKPPQLCPRFPEQREILSLDVGFAQTPVLREIFSFWDYIASPQDIHQEMKRFGVDLEVISSKIAPSVVAVSSFYGSKIKFDCSGLIIHWSSSEKEAIILTSAKLLYYPKGSEVEFHLIVRMADGTLLLAKEDHVDYYYNLLTLKVKPVVEPEVVDLRSRQAGVVDGMKVISFGRSLLTSTLYGDRGKLFEYPPSFGCYELSATDCGIREIGEGGPLVNDAGYVVGINFFGHYRCAQALPTPTILSCLEMWKSFSTVLRPWFGIRVIDVKQYRKLVSNPGKELDASNRDLSVSVEEVHEGSVAYKYNVKSGDKVVTLNGTKIETVKQYSQLLSEASRAATTCESGHRLMAVINPFDRPTDDIIIEADNISVDDKRFSSCWPLLVSDDWDNC